MKTTSLIWGLVGIFVVSTAVVVYHVTTNNQKQKTLEAFTYDIDRQKEVPENLIGYEETKQLSIKSGVPVAFEMDAKYIYLLLENGMQIIDQNGKEFAFHAFTDKPTCLAINDAGSVFVAFGRYVVEYNALFKEVRRSTAWGDSSFFSSIAAGNDRIFIADAGKKVVRVLDDKLHALSQFSGESGVSDQHGFIVPSAHFDVRVNKEGELWVTNPGMHLLQQYTQNGALKSFWGEAAFHIGGFSGCCNPFYFDWLKDGRFVTSEKGLVRVKISSPSGDLVSVVAAPTVFGKSTKAPDIAVDEEDNVWILDFDKKLLRVFVPKTTV